MKLILASSSPRRQEILRSRGYEFTVEAADIDEIFDKALTQSAAMQTLAVQMAQKVHEKHPDDVVIGADTMVFLGCRALGKPADEADAREILTALSGRWHYVCSAVAVLSPLGTKTFLVRTQVKFYALSQGLITRYIATGEPLDKAGAYGIQGHGALLVEEVRGDYLNIVGLPMGELTQTLASIGITPHL